MWGPRFLAAAAAGALLTVILGIFWGPGVMVVSAVAVALIGRAHPVVNALALTATCVLDPMAADYLNNTMAGNTLGQLTGGLWRYNTVNYVIALVAVTNLPLLRTSLQLPHARWALGLLATVVAWLVLSADLVIGLQLVLDIVAYFGLLTLFMRIASDREAFFWVGVLGGTLGACLTPLYFIEQPSALATNPNAMVFLPVTALFATWMGAVGAHASPRRNVVLGLLAAVNLLWAFLSTSRGGLLIAAVGLLFMLASMNKARARVVLVGALVLGGLLLTSSFAEMQEQAVERLTLLFDSSVSERARTSGRSDLVLGAWEIFKNNPFGVGTGSFETQWALLSTVGGQREFFQGGHKFSAHAGWLRVLTENGIVGITLLTGFVGSFLFASLRRWRQGDPRWIGAGVTLALSVALLTSEFHLKGLFFLAAGATVLLHAPRGGPAVPSEPVPRHRRPTLVRPRNPAAHETS